MTPKIKSKKGRKPMAWIDKKGQFQVNMSNRLINELAPEDLPENEKGLFVARLIESRIDDVVNLIK